MRRVFLLLLLPVLAATACRGTQPYTSLDLSQTRTAYRQIVPTYIRFKKAFEANNASGILLYYHRERVECRLEDKVDKRDSIDPNVNLFQVGVGLDNLCNGIESAFAAWGKQHGYPYLKSVVPARPFEAFVVSDASFADLPKEMKRPAALGS